MASLSEAIMTDSFNDNLFMDCSLTKKDAIWDAIRDAISDLHLTLTKIK